MKKIFTLITGLFLAIALMAADRRPVVTVNTMQNFKIVIDGRTYFSNNNSIRIQHLRSGYHAIQVFEMRRGYFDRRERLVSSSSFFIRNRDVRITIGYFGKIIIREDRRFRGFDRDDNDRRDWDDREQDRRFDDNRRF
ncbi:MAG: hypothetical protein ACO25B_12220 [Chitinophagaceae bacterium]